MAQLPPYVPPVTNFLNNFSAGSLDRWARAKARVQSGTANARVAFAGTSIILGAYAGNATPNLVRPNGHNVKVAGLLNASGLPATFQSFIGNGYSASSGAFGGFDSRLSLGSFSSSSNSGFTVGGFGSIASGVGTLAFTFSGAVDTLVLYELQYGNAGSYSLNIDTTTIISAAQSQSVGPTAINKRTFTFSAIGAGSHTLNIGWVSGSPNIVGAELYLSTSPVISCLNCGAGGSTSANWINSNGNTYGGAFYDMGQAIAPDLIIWEMGANDWIGAVSVATFAANVKQTLTRYLISSDIIGFTPPPSQNSYIPLTTQQQYVDALIGVYQTLGVPYFDYWRQQVSWEKQNALGMTQDNVHPNALGVWHLSNTIAKALLSA